MEQRVRKLETEVAVLGNRQDTSEAEIATIREDIRNLSAKMDKIQGVILVGVAVAQAIGIMFAG